MINWKELEKVIAPGKVMTLVIMIDGKEIGALSFNVDTLAYKAILETVKTTEPVKVAEKPIEKKSEPIKKDTKKADKNDKTGKHPEFNPIPATNENTKDEKPMTRESVLAADEPKVILEDKQEQIEEEKEDIESQPTLSEEW